MVCGRIPRLGVLPQKKYSNKLGLLYIAILIYLNIFEVWVWGISPPKECQFLQLFRVAKVIGYV
jgi:hypothetical protein